MTLLSVVRGCLLLTATAGAACSSQLVASDNVAANITSVNFSVEGTGTGGALSVGVRNVGDTDLQNLVATVRYYDSTGKDVFNASASAASVLPAGASETLYQSYSMSQVPPAGACARATLTGSAVGSTTSKTLDSTYSTCP